MNKKFTAIRGMPDVLPQNVAAWHAFEDIWRKLISAYGYEEIRLPILETTGLFKRSIGEATDIVEKEMFTFQSKDDKESLTMRPEGTAGCVRAGIEHGLLYHQIRRMWYMGPMFRYERPQKGRYRQFHQVGVEAFGLSDTDIEVEQLLLTARLWRELKIDSAITLEVNSLGSLEARRKYRQILVDYLEKYQKDLDEDSQRRLVTNPLRILDSKNPAMQDIIAGAPKCQEYLDDDSVRHFNDLLQRLSDLGVSYQVNPNLVRGLDYYNRTVYEWVTDKLGAQGAVCAGGRYDTLVEQLGGNETPAVGFAMGIERILLLQEALGIESQTAVDIYFIHAGAKAERECIRFSEELRDFNLSWRMIVHSGGGNFKHQFKQADKSGAKIALILGDEELEKGAVSVKFMRAAEEQLSISRNEVKQFLINHLGR